MTRAEVMKMEGRELDAMIARRAFGYKSWTSAKYPDHITFLSPSEHAEHGVRYGAIIEVESGGEDLCPPPKFSTSLDAVRQAELEIVKRGLLTSYSQFVWDLTREEWKRSDHALIMADATTRARAILMVLGVE